MYRGITPTITMVLPEGTDLSFADYVYVTFSNQKKTPTITKSGADLSIDENIVVTELTQAETLALGETVLVQINWVTNNKRACTNVVGFNTKRNLLNEVLP